MSEGISKLLVGKRGNGNRSLEKNNLVQILINLSCSVLLFKFDKISEHDFIMFYWSKG